MLDTASDIINNMCIGWESFLTYVTVTCRHWTVKQTCVSNVDNSVVMIPRHF